MMQKDIQKRLDDLGIVSIEASGDLSAGLINDAIASTENLMKNINLEELVADINKAEEVFN